MPMKKRVTKKKVVAGARKVASKKKVVRKKRVTKAPVLMSAAAEKLAGRGSGRAVVAASVSYFFNFSKPVQGDEVGVSK